jgi:hypothetical protein
MLFAALAGWVYFRVSGPPVPAPGNAQPFTPWYTALHVADVLLPSSPFGQENRWNPGGLSEAVAAALQALGWILALAIVPAITRLFTRT